MPNSERAAVPLRFPCVVCNAGIIERYDDPDRPDVMTSGPSTCWSCGGTGKSDRQLLIEIQATQDQILALLQRPAPSPTPGRRDVVYGPGWRQKPVLPILTGSKEYQDSMREEMAAWLAKWEEEAKQGK